MKTITKKGFDFSEMKDLVNKKLGYDQRSAGKHFYPNSVDFYEWHKKKKYPKKDSEGNDIGISQIWYTEFKKEVDSGGITEVPYLDFWHYQLKNCFAYDVRNDSFNKLNIDLIFGKDTESWIKEIQTTWNELFKDLADENGYVDVYLYW